MSHEDLQTAGERMRWLRLSKDFTQGALGEQAHVTQRMISYFERDEFVPRPAIRRAIAETLGVHPDFIWRPEDLVKRKRVAA